MNIVFSTAALSTLSADALVVVVGQDWKSDLSDLDAKMDGQLIAWLESESFSGTLRRVPTFGKLAANNLVVVPVKKGDIHQAVAKAGRACRKHGFESVVLSGVPHDQFGTAIEMFGSGNYVFDRYIREEDRDAPTSTLTLLGDGSEATAQTANIRMRWQNWTRDLVNLPPADLYPESLAKATLDAMAGIEGVTIEVIDFDTCKKRNYVGIVAVGQGSVRPGCMIHVSYRPKNPTQHIAFVGKGVTFDAGGLSIKPSGSMQTMRCDMGGAATVLGATGVLAELGSDVAIDCFVGAVENLVDGNSFKLGDILTYNNGVTVEIHNTDAEGRLVMADCLIEACKVEGVTTVIDAATLTGACLVALGEDFTGMFTHDDALAAELTAAAHQAKDGIWRLPLHTPYNDKLKGTWSQIKNLGDRFAGATTAALYLEHFVSDDVRWCHLDIAGSSWRDSATSTYAAGGTGQMVRGLANWVDNL